jgi:hypothetical protein
MRETSASKPLLTHRKPIRRRQNRRRAILPGSASFATGVRTNPVLLLSVAPAALCCAQLALPKGDGAGADYTNEEAHDIGFSRLDQ